MTNWSRRDWLKYMGACAATAPYLNIFSPTAAQAQGGGARAQRLLIFFSPNGTIPRLWRPQGGEQNFDFAQDGMLTPLRDYRDDLLVLDGLNFLTGNNHEGGMGAMLTNGNGDGSVSAGRSVDQFIGDAIGQDDRFSTMEFGILTDPWGASIQTRMSYSSAGQYVHPDADPRSVFRRMFGAIDQDEQALENIRLRRRSILDLSLAQTTDLKRRVGRIEREKLDRHLTSIRELERSLFPERVDACVVPPAPGRLSKDDFAAVPQITRAQIDLAVTALACQMTKVATIQLSHTVSPVVFSWVGNTDGHHALSHAADGDQVNIGQFRDAERWCAEQFAYIIDTMKATPNPSGEGSLFDDTLILWAKELGDSRLHVCESVPFVLAGPAGGVFRPGRYLDYGGVSHSHLLVSLCQAFGLDVDHFGDPSTGRGGLDRLV